MVWKLVTHARAKHNASNFIIIIIIIIIIGRTAIFKPWPPLENSADFDPVFTSLDFATVNLYRARSSALRPTPQPGGPGPCIYVPQ
jgi:hypothetical protein